MNLILIPARFASARFPGKPLVDLKGKPMIQRVWEQACKAKGVDAVGVATDDRRIATVVKAFGGTAVMTPVSCVSGTDRIARAARKWRLKDSDLVINVQGDEPLLPPKMIEELVALMKKSGAPMGTLCRAIRNSDEWASPNCVKAIYEGDRALYFSRVQFKKSPKNSKGMGLHVGIYAYRWGFLKKLAKLRQTPMEKLERLEQLRVLENGYSIAIAETSLQSQAVDTPTDAAKVRALIK